MGKKTKIWLIIAGSLILAGCLIFGGVITILKLDFTKLSTIKYETNHHEITEDYQNLSVVTDTADILFVPSENDKSTVVCHEQTNAKHTVKVKENTLVIEINDNRKWYEWIGINFDTPKIMVYIPQGQYSALTVTADTGDVKIPKDFQFQSIDITESTGHVTNFASASETVKIKTSTGDIHIESISAGALDLSVSTGKITVSNVACQGDAKLNVSTGKTNLSNITCKNLISCGNTGNIFLDNVIAAEKFSIERSTGDVKFQCCDANEIFVETDTGSVTGTLLSEKVFIPKTDTGKIHVPKTTTGGRCEITTNTGDIKISIEQ